MLDMGEYETSTTRSRAWGVPCEVCGWLASCLVQDFIQVRFPVFRLEFDDKQRFYCDEHRRAPNTFEKKPLSPPGVGYSE
jgi:hypothetical protein